MIDRSYIMNNREKFKEAVVKKYGNNTFTTAGEALTVF